MTERSVVIRLKAEISEFTAKMRAAGASAKDALGDALGSAEQKAALNDLGNTAGKIGVVAAAGFGLAVGAAANFDQAMSNVAATGEDARANIEALREAAIQAGADTAFSASEAAEGLENLAKAGVDSADALGGGLQGALDLAAAGQMDVADAAEAAAGAMAQFNLSGAEVPHVADLLAAGAGKAQGEVSDMVYALKQSGLVAAQMGLSLEETVGSLSAFADSSLLGSDAGTSFKTMLAALTPNSEKAASAMEQYNIHAFDAQGNFVGMVEFARQLEEGLGDLTTEQRASTMETIFGSDAVRAASVIYDQGADGVKKWIDQTNDAGYAAEVAGERLNNLKGDLEEFQGSLETALIGTGDGAQTPLRELTQTLTGVVNGYNDMGEGAKNATLGMLGITAVLGGGLWFTSKVIRGIGETADALKTLGVTADKTKGALTGVGKGLGVAAVALAADAFIADLGDVDYSLEQMERRLTLMGQTGAAGDLFDDLTYGAESLSDALHQAVFNDLDVLNRKLFGSNASFGVAKEIKELDEALAGMDAADALHAFDTLVDEGRAAGLTVAQVTELFPEYRKERELAAEEDLAAAYAGREASAAARSAADGITEVGDAAADAAEEVVALDDAFAGLSGGFLSQREAARASRDATRDIKEALKDYREEHESLKGAFKDGTKSGDEFDAMLDDLAVSYQEQLIAMSEAGESERKIQKEYERSRKRLLDVAEQLGYNKTEAEEYAAAVLDIPAFVETTVKLNVVADVSGAALDAFGGGILSGKRKRKADGGAIHGPGTGTSDSIPALLSNGEHVLTAAEVQKAGGHGAIYAWRQMIRGYAAGGAVSFASRPAPVAAFANGGAVGGGTGGRGGAPMIGTQYVMPHNYNEFVRQQEANQRAADGGGI